MHTATWVNPENIMLSEDGNHKQPYVIGFHRCKISRIGRSIEVDSG